MEHPYILPYLEQRMKEIGHDKFHYKTVRIKNLNFGNYESNPFDDIIIVNNRYGQFVNIIDASNQYLFLIEKMISHDLKITSDTGYLLPSESLNYSNYTFHNFKEFTGQVIITDSNPFELEFIQVSPYETHI